jgi:hexokinase
VGASKYSQKEKSKVISALNSVGFMISDENRDKYVGTFVSELKKGLKGAKSSLNILPSFIKFTDKLTKDGKIAVLDIGKMDLLKAYFEPRDTGAEVYGVMSAPLPGLGKEISKDEFFKKVIFEVRDVLRTSQKIGVCICYPVEMNEKCDGKLLAWSRKNIKIPELVGLNLGEEFKKYLEDEFDKEYKILVVNDDVATLFAGLSAAVQSEYEDFIGIIHDVGYNIAYLENGKNIAGATAGTQVAVSTQAGAFDKIINSVIDKNVRDYLKHEHPHAFSQMVNTKSFPLYLRALVCELEGSILNPKACKRIRKMDDLDLEQIFSYLACGLKSSSKLSSIVKYASLKDAANLSIIIDLLVQRVARLVAVQICGLLEYKDVGHNPLQPVGIVVEGEFFGVIKDFEQRVKCEVNDYFQDDLRYLKFLHISNAPLMGAGIAASLNL